MEGLIDSLRLLHLLIELVAADGFEVGSAAAERQRHIVLL